MGLTHYSLSYEKGERARLSSAENAKFATGARRRYFRKFAALAAYSFASMQTRLFVEAERVAIRNQILDTLQ